MRTEEDEEESAARIVAASAMPNRFEWMIVSNSPPKKAMSMPIHARLNRLEISDRPEAKKKKAYVASRQS